MTGLISRPLIARAMLALLVCAGADELAAQQKLLTPPDRRDVQTEMLQAITRLGIEDEQALEKVTKLWAENKGTEPREVLELVVSTFALVHPETGRFVDSCRYDRPTWRVPRMPTLESAPRLYSASLGLFYGRYLAQRRLYDEAYEVLKPIDAGSVADPATLLFFRAVCEQELLKKDEGLATLDLLLKRTVGVPASHQQVAELMQFELKNLRPKSLDELARMMADVERRLELGRGGQKVQKREREIVARLDELIEKLEQQQGGGGSSAQNQGGNQNEPAQAAQDSRVKGSKGEGEVDEKKLAGQGGWGMLDPKAETRARESIKRNFPSHYGEAIKRYNIKLAR